MYNGVVAGSQDCLQMASATTLSDVFASLDLRIRQYDISREGNGKFRPQTPALSPPLLLVHYLRIKI